MDPWIPVLEAPALGRAPARVDVAGLPVVLFRAADGRPRALLDRCPHRGVPLSIGTCRKGRIACAYHGWEFDGDGRCLRIPSNVEPEGPPLPRAMARAFAVEERDGKLWVRVDA